MRGWRALLLTIVLLSGCLGGPQGDDADTLDAASVAGDGGSASDKPSSSSSSSSSAPASSSASPASGGSTSSNGSADATLPPVVVPLEFQGSIPAFVEPCVWALVTGLCVALPPGDFQNRFALEQDGTLSRATMTLEWTPSSPVTEQLGFAFFSYTEDDFVEHAMVFGPSPLVIDLSEVELPAGHTHEVMVFAGWTGVGALVAGAEVAANPQEQPFAIMGELVLPAPANP